MVLIVDSKSLYPSRHVPAPPPYTRSPSVPPSGTLHPSPAANPPQLKTASFQALPQHIVLNIVAACVPPRSARSSALHIEALYWLDRSLRLTSRAIYVACMHFLRSSFLDAYVGLVKAPYTTDPFPLEPPEANLPPGYVRPSGITSLQRETAVLDRFIAIKCGEDVRLHETELHLDLDHFKDIYDLSQPKARMEDLVRRYGVRAGVISLVAPPMSASASTSKLPTPLPFTSVSVSFSPRKVGLVVLRRTVVEVKRERDEKLESVAKRLINELARVLGRT